MCWRAVGGGAVASRTVSGLASSVMAADCSARAVSGYTVRSARPSAASASALLRSSRCSRRTLAWTWRRFSSSPSAGTGGTAVGDLGPRLRCRARGHVELYRVLEHALLAKPGPRDRSPQHLERHTDQRADADGQAALVDVEGGAVV